MITSRLDSYLEEKVNEEREKVMSLFHQCLVFQPEKRLLAEEMKRCWQDH